MNDKLELFYRGLKDQKVSFIGLGRSHRELLPMFASKGARVSLRDKRTREQIGEEAGQLEALGIRLILGKGYLDNLCEEDMILRTPGMYYYHSALQEAQRSGVAVVSEMELFFDLCPCKIYAVTGSDGKTTTTSVIAEFLKAQGFNVFLGGNIGFPLLPRIEQIGPEDRAVVELSSFQMISMRKSPDVAVITNISPNHLDVHKDMQEYIDAKRNIYLHQGGLSRTVLNADNEITASFVPQVRGMALQFSRRTKPALGAYLGEDGVLYMNDRKGTTAILPMDQIRIPGIHNVENYLAAISAVCGRFPGRTSSRWQNLSPASSTASSLCGSWTGSNGTTIRLPPARPGRLRGSIPSIRKSSCLRAATTRRFHSSRWPPRLWKRSRR